MGVLTYGTTLYECLCGRVTNVHLECTTQVYSVVVERDSKVNAWCLLEARDDINIQTMKTELLTCMECCSLIVCLALKKECVSRSSHSCLVWIAISTVTSMYGRQFLFEDYRSGTREGLASCTS